MNRTADRGRQRVYDTEVSAFGGTILDEVLAWDDLVATFHAAVHHPWWRSLGLPDPVLVRARTDSHRSSADGTTIRIAREGRTALTLAHELAHHLVTASELSDPGHGPSFRAALLRTVELVGGSTARQVLDAELTAARLAPGHWPLTEPPTGPGVCTTLRDAGPGRLRGAIPLPPP